MFEIKKIAASALLGLVFLDSWVASNACADPATGRTWYEVMNSPAIDKDGDDPTRNTNTVVGYAADDKTCSGEWKSSDFESCNYKFTDIQREGFEDRVGIREFYGRDANKKPTAPGACAANYTRSRYWGLTCNDYCVLNRQPAGYCFEQEVMGMNQEPKLVPHPYCKCLEVVKGTLRDLDGDRNDIVPIRSPFTASCVEKFAGAGCEVERFADPPAISRDICVDPVKLIERRANKSATQDGKEVVVNCEAGACCEKAQSNDLIVDCHNYCVEWLNKQAVDNKQPPPAQPMGCCINSQVACSEFEGKALMGRCVCDLKECQDAFEIIPGPPVIALGDPGSSAGIAMSDPGSNTGIALSDQGSSSQGNISAYVGASSEPTATSAMGRY